jgi:hypothetical protein
VVPDGGKEEVYVRVTKFRWKPGIIVVRDKGGDESATVQVRDTTGTLLASGRVGRRLGVPITDPVDPTRKVSVTVVPTKGTGGSVRRFPASVSAGTTVNLDVNL